MILLGTRGPVGASPPSLTSAVQLVEEHVCGVVDARGVSGVGATLLADVGQLLVLQLDSLALGAELGGQVLERLPRPAACTEYGRRL